MIIVPCWIPLLLAFANISDNLDYCPQDLSELENWLGDLNPQSKVVMPCAYAVPTLRNAAVGDSFQFERLGKV